ncbi:response regulator [Antarcticimicrobium sediminis]|uniref:Response regulator n=1 Tax=Antarcticimicrobium sediminis TaxID=2546227 RepID=A0A4R5EPM1_9RHOB|nr:response regulator [Antarcticimicrobium sediminis]TDE36681.1 response regulator [Antarcticimicrobium sediminis]
MDDTDPIAQPGPQGDSGRPLLGLTVLAVEDSTYAAEALRLMCLRSGARIRRADCLKSARKHLQVYQPTVLIADLGLPDGSGLHLIEELAAASPRISVILGLSGDSFGEETAIAAGADGFLAKPIPSLARFQAEILGHLPIALTASDFDLPEVGPIHPDPLAYRDDMAHAADLLSDSEQGKMLDYVAQFLRGVARSAEDTALVEAANGLAQARAQGAPLASATARIAGLVQQRLREARPL